MTRNKPHDSGRGNRFGSSSRRSALKLLGAAGAVGLAGCTGAFQEGNEWEETIGVLVPQTGPLAGIGQQAEQAVEIAFDHASDRTDMDLSFEIRDTEGDVEVARTGARELIEEGAPVLAGMVSSDSALAIRDITEEEGVPIVNAYANSDEVTADGTDYTYRYIGNSTQEMGGTMSFWANEGVSNVALIAADYSFGRSVGEVMRARAEEFDQTIDNVSFLPVTTNNFRPELRDLDAESLDAIFIAFPGENGPVLVQQLEEEGFLEETIVTGNYSYSTNIMRMVVGDQLPGLTAWGVDRSAAPDLQSAFADRYDTRMDSLHALPYDTFTVAFEALSTAAELGPEAVNDAMSDIDYEGSTGIPASFGEDGHNVSYRQLITEWQVVDGELEDEVVFTSETLSPSS
jgi:branched-chain amino acid transport system substrate-binding protein